MDSKKKWMIGCGGCLGIVVIAVVIAVIAGIWGFNTVKEQSDKTVASVLGTAPAGYTPMGMPLSDKMKGIMLLNMSDGTVMFAVDQVLPPQQIEALQHGDEDEVKAELDQMMDASGTSASSYQFEGTGDLTLPTGTHNTYRIKFSRKGKYSPLALSMLFYPQNRVVFLANMAADTQSGSSEADFAPEYQGLESSMAGVIEETSLKNDLKSPAQ